MTKNPATIRSAERYRRAAYTIPRITLDVEHADKLHQLRAARDGKAEESVSECVRRLIRRATK